MTAAPFEVVVVGASVPDWVVALWPSARCIVPSASASTDGRVATSWWHATEQRTMGEVELTLAAAHHRVWLGVLGSGRPTLVVESGAEAVGDVAAAVEVAVGATGEEADAEPLVILSGVDDPAAAYVVSAFGAGALIAIVDAAGLAPADAVLARVGRLLQVQPPVVGRAHRPSPGAVHAAHLTVGPNPPGAGGGVWCHPGPEAVVVDEMGVAPAALLLGLAQLGGGLVVSADGTAALGPTALVSAWLAGDLDDVEVVIDDERLLFLPAGDDPGEWAVLGGRLHHARTGTAPVVMTDLGAHESSADLLEARSAADRSHDLVQLLGYVDAIDSVSPWEAWTEVAPEILQVPLWTPQFCAVVVRAVQACGAWAANPQDPVPGRELPLNALSGVLGTRLDEHLRSLVWPVLHQHWPYAEDQGIDDAFIITYAVGQQEELRIHHDLAQISASIKLNEGFDGGLLTFPRQGWDNHDQPVGSMLVWPSLVTHPHLSTPITRGVKHALTIWFRLPEG